MAEKMFSYDDLKHAMADYDHAKSEQVENLRMAEVKRKEAASFDVAAALKDEAVARAERKIQEIIRDLKKL